MIKILKYNFNNSLIIVFLIASFCFRSAASNSDYHMPLEIALENNVFRIFDFVCFFDKKNPDLKPLIIASIAPSNPNKAFISDLLVLKPQNIPILKSPILDHNLLKKSFQSPLLKTFQSWISSDASDDSENIQHKLSFDMFNKNPICSKIKDRSMKNAFCFKQSEKVIICINISVPDYNHYIKLINENVLFF